MCKDVYLCAIVCWDSKFPLPWVSKGLFTALTKKTLLNTSCVSFKRVRWTKHNKGWQLERGCVQFNKRNVLNRTDKPATKTAQMCLYVGRRGHNCSLKWFFCLLTACSVAPRCPSWWHLKLDLSKPSLHGCSAKMTHHRNICFLKIQLIFESVIRPMLVTVTLEAPIQAQTQIVTTVPILHVKCNLKWIYNGEKYYLCVGLLGWFLSISISCILE